MLAQSHLDHPLLMLPTTHKDTGDARYTLQGAIATPRHPTDQAMPSNIEPNDYQVPNNPADVPTRGNVPPTHYTPLGPPPGPTQRPTVTWNLPKN